MTVTNGDILKGFIEIVLGDGTITQNVFHFKADFADDQNDSAVTNAVESYIEDIYSAVSAYLSDDFTINPGYLHRVWWNPALSAEEVIALVGVMTPSFTHTNTDDPFPNQIAPVLTANTYAPGHFGRKFLTGFVEASADAGDLISAVMTAMGNALNHYIADETISAGNDLIVGVPNTADGSWQSFSNGVANSVVGTQRRRKPGVGT